MIEIDEEGPAIAVQARGGWARAALLQDFISGTPCAQVRRCRKLCFRGSLRQLAKAMWDNSKASLIGCETLGASSGPITASKLSIRVASCHSRERVYPFSAKSRRL